jgi:hypothetical protein
MMLVNGYTIEPTANLTGANLTAANLYAANLCAANLSGANLRATNLTAADLHAANLTAADLTGANLTAADLTGANLTAADLSGANLTGANLTAADLSGANLCAADLSGANLRGTKNIPPLFQAISIIAGEGDLIGYKKLANGTICKLKIPADAKRSNSAGRKCRAEFAVVLEGEGVSQHDGTFTYKVGETVRSRKPFDDNRWEECASGIHFFLTREEANAY